MLSGYAVRRPGLLALTCSVLALSFSSAARSAGDAAAEPTAPVAATIEAAQPAAVPPLDAQAAPAAAAASPEAPAVVAPAAAAAATPAAVETAAPASVAPAVAVAVPAPMPVVDPIITAVQARLAKPVAGLAKDDAAALAAFYGKQSSPVFVSAGGLTPRAQAVIAEIAKADDWGLSAKAFALPSLPAQPDAAALPEAEFTVAAAVLKYARQASGGRADPSTLSRFNDMRGTFADPDDVLLAVATSDKPADYLISLHPKHPQFVKLREALLKARSGATPKDEPAAEQPKAQIADGVSLKPGAQHADIIAVRERLGVQAEAGSEATYDKALVAAVKAFQEERGLKASGVITNATRAALNGNAAKAKPAPAADPAKNVERIVLNMERWRWMPQNLGTFHILNNVPEYVTRVYKAGAIVHQEKIIVGKTNTPTSVFSANMQFVIFHPEWGVPDSIKIKEILPSLRRKSYENDFFGFGGGGSDTRILQRHNMRVSYNGKVVDASKIDWSTTDPRQYQFIQAAGGANVLGVVKFRFPNRHDIYMHDTPQRELFAQTTRTFSHGCMRVNNPRRLAEVILAEDRGWSAERVGAQIASSQSLEVKMEKPFPVHVTYFTARVDEDGKLKTFADIYGHDARLSAALSGKPVKLEEPEQASEAVAAVQKRAPGQAKQKQQADLGNFLQGIFGN